MYSDKIFGSPSIHPESFVSSKSTIIGLVTTEEGVIIAPNCSIRADECSPFLIRKGTNIQDGVIIHGLLEQYVLVDGKKYSVYIGPHCSVAHGALIHGPTEIGKKVFIGFRSTVHCSKIGRNSFIGHGAMVLGVTLPEKCYVPDGMIINNQILVDSLPQVTKEHLNFNHEVVDYNKKLVRRYKERRKIKIII